MIRLGLAFCCLATLPLSAQERVTDGLQLLYRFDETDGDLVADESGAAEPIDLFLGDPQAAVWSAGGLHLLRPTIVLGDLAPRRVVQSVVASGALTLECWASPDALDQSGPARVFTISSDTSTGNATIGQENDRWIVRVRTTETDGTGHNRALSAPIPREPGLIHAVFTRDRAGVARLYINGEQQFEGPLPGDFHGWDESFRLALGNEVEDDRAWLGELHLAAVYESALTAGQVAAHHRAGVELLGTDALPDLTVPPLALYRFDSTEGDQVLDRSGIEPPLDLTIADPEAVTRQPGMLRINRPTRIVSVAPARKITDACWITGEISVEVWCRPAGYNLEGPARIVTLSRNGALRNWTLGQAGDTLVARLRTPTSGDNGMNPELRLAGGFAPGLSHVVYTRGTDGVARLYVNGTLAAEEAVPGTLANWEPDVFVALGNEITEDRPWRGTVRLAALYDRVLLPDEVAQNHAAGP